MLQENESKENFGMSDNDEHLVPHDSTAQPFFCPNCRSRTAVSKRS
jgi:hypothetical protein